MGETTPREPSSVRTVKIALYIGLILVVWTALADIALILVFFDVPGSVPVLVADYLNFLSFGLFINFVFCLFAASHMNKIRSALKGGEADASRLHEANSLPWAVFTLLFVNAISAVMLFVIYGPIKRLYPPVAGAVASDVVLSVEHLYKFFPVKRTLSQLMRGSQDIKVHAVDDVSFEVKRAQVYGLAGESGSGKTTVLRTALRLTSPTSGKISFQGKDLSKLTKKEMKRVRTKLQVVFQDPYESVNPRMSVFDIVGEGLFVNNLVSSREEARERVMKALRDVQLTPAEEYLDRFPHELSGGQRQRVAIARALVLEPELILADEPVSMLDVSVRAEVINVLLSIRDKSGISVMMVTHDLALSKDVVDELAIMYLGKIVESGPAEAVVSGPYHPYTDALVAAVPVPDPVASKIKVLAKGEIPTNISPPPGCRFHPRCPLAQEICEVKEPELAEVTPGRRVACHFWKEAHEAFLSGTLGGGKP